LIKSQINEIEDILIISSSRNSNFKEKDLINKFEILQNNIIFSLYKLFQKELILTGVIKEEEIDVLKKNKNFLYLKSTAERTIIFSSFKISYSYFLALFEVAKYNSDHLNSSKAKEGIACAFILYDLFKTYKKDLRKFITKELVFNEEIEAILFESYNYIKKTKISELMIDSLFKFIFYYMFFENKMKNMLEYEKKILEELKNVNNPEYKIFCFLKLKFIFDYIKFKRKSIYYIYMVSNINII